MYRAVLVNCEGVAGISAAVNALRNNASPLDAVEIGIRIVERDPTVRSVGFGGAPNLRGEAEFDAAIMEGTTLRAGAVAALKGYRSPISVARQVMERTPHVLLAGDGAARFAAEIGADSGDMLSPEAARDYRDWVAEHTASDDRQRWPDMPMVEYAWMAAKGPGSRGTTTFLVQDADGHMAGGVSTSGLAYKYPGRVGDSAVIGAGLYVDDRYGAVACTHTGEMTIRAATARSVVMHLKAGTGLHEACREAIKDLHSLQRGHLGPVVIHAMDKDGALCVVSTGHDAGVPYWHWNEGRGDVERGTAIIQERVCG